MSKSKNTINKRSAKRIAFREKFLKELAKRPLISDEEFMAEFEASDEQYAIGLVLPGIRDRKRGKDE